MQESIAPTDTADPDLGPAGARLEPDERRFQELIEAIPFIAWVVDDLGRLQHANGQWSVYAGRPPTLGAAFVDDPVDPPRGRRFRPGGVA